MVLLGVNLFPKTHKPNHLVFFIQTSSINCTSNSTVLFFIVRFDVGKKTSNLSMSYLKHSKFAVTGNVNVMEFWA